MQEATRSTTACVTLHTVGLPAQRVKDKKKEQTEKTDEMTAFKVLQRP